MKFPNEVCEGGCFDPVVAHDRDGVPFCRGCYDVLREEWAAMSPSERNEYSGDVISIDTDK